MSYKIQCRKCHDAPVYLEGSSHCNACLCEKLTDKLDNSPMELSSWELEVVPQIFDECNWDVKYIKQAYYEITRRLKEVNK